VIYVQGCFIVGQPFRTLGSHNVYTKLHLIFPSNYSSEIRRRVAQIRTPSFATKDNLEMIFM
jgi:hypothetical protein